MNNIFNNDKDSKNVALKSRIVNYFIMNGNSTNNDLAKELGLSVPTVAKIIGEMCEDGFIDEYGKLETDEGRKPNLYGLNPNSGYFVGVDMVPDEVNIGLMNFRGDLIDLDTIAYHQQNTMESLDELCNDVVSFIDKSKINKSKILNVNFNISGRVNPDTGYSYSIFNFSETSLCSLISEKIGYPVNIENDTRAMTYGEYMAGCVKGESNILFVNLSWGLGMGIIINGKTLEEWIDYNSENISYPRNDGVTCFPVNAGKMFNPVSVEVGTTRLSFKFSLEEIPLDSVVVTFKAGLFYGYYNNTTFTLDKDITYYANVTTSNGPSRIVFSKTPNWVETYQGIREVADWGEETASQGGKYHRWLIVTNIARDTDNIKQACPADNYRYMFDNILMNGKSLAHYNAWARGNSKDFTNLADASTQNPAYEVGHPTGSANVKYDLALRIEVITDQAKYYLAISVPNQLLVDLSMVGNPTFALRDGSAWLSIVDGQSKVVRYDAQTNANFAAVTAFANGSLHMADYNDSLGYCNDNEHHYYLTAKAAYNDLTDSQKAMFTTWGEFAAAKARYEKWAEFNHDANPYDGNDTIVSVLEVPMFNESNNFNTMVVVISLMTVFSAAILFITLRKKRTNK